MRMTNTKPWWKEFNRRVTCIGHTYTTQATIKSPGQHEIAVVHFFLDWDTRQDYYVVLPYGFCDYMDPYKREDVVRDALKMYWNLLSPSVRIIALDEDQRIQAVSSNPAELIGFPEEGINTLFSYCAWPRLEDITEFSHLPVIRRSQMIEVDRLAPRVDVMEDTSRNGERVVAKWLLADAHHTWREMRGLTSIPSHPHIVPIYRIIVDDTCQRIVGWASKHIDGLDLEIDKSHFKMKWLMQLTQTLDYLHLELGILHGDLQLKNMLLDKATDNILLIDFENAAQLNKDRLQWEFNQLTWSVYEIVTHDSALCEEKLYDLTPDDENPDAYYSCDPSVINEMPEWPARTNLDCESEEIRQYLQNWIQRRKALSVTTPKNPIKILHECPKPSSAVMQNREARKARFEEIRKRQMEQQEEKESLPVGELRWERPPYTTAYPNREDKTKSHSNPGPSVSRKRSLTPDSLEGVQKQEGKPLADIEGEESRRKRAKVSDAAVEKKEDIECHERYVESEAAEIPTPPHSSTDLDTAKGSDKT